MTQIIKASDMSLLLEALDQGQLISFPTETVYGLACRFNDREALEKLLEVKGRDRDKPITLMIAYKEDIGQYGYVNERIQRVIDEFMPGSITLILKRKKSVDPAMTGGLDTVGIRIPNSPFVLSLLEAGELLVTSANLAGGKNTTNEKEVLEQLDGKIAYVVKGQTGSNKASTVVDLTGDRPVLLRKGPISLKKIEEVYYEGSSRM